MRNPIWRAIHDTLLAEVAQGHYPLGAKLPSEAELALRFGVNRHTVRQALGALIAAGWLRSRRGAGVFVAQARADYPLGVRTRFHQNISALGKVPGRRFTRLETRLASAEEALPLQIKAGERVHVAEGVSLADDQPMALFHALYPAAALPDLLADLARLQSVTAALAAGGVADYTRASTRITAELATTTQALALHVKENAPLLKSEAINVEGRGMVVEYGQTWFAAERVALTFGD